MFYFSRFDFQFQTPFCMIISGPSGSGKTTFLLRFLNESKNLIYPEQPKSILYCYSEYHDHIKTLQAGGISVHQGIPDDKQPVKLPAVRKTISISSGIFAGNHRAH